MKNFNCLTMAAIIVFAFGLSVQAQEKTPVAQSPTAAQKAKTPTALPSDLIAFFAGEWEGAGKFASGKKIEADAKFSVELDNQWLLYSHRDRAPNKYKSLGMWGFERQTGKFVMIVEDNFGGTRRFESDGWSNGKMIFTSGNNETATNFIERFSFEKQTEKSFKMTYESSRDGAQWRLGDYLIFNRK